MKEIFIIKMYQAETFLQEMIHPVIGFYCKNFQYHTRLDDINHYLNLTL